MAFSEDALRAKLSTLNETQESIVSVSQWITFHRRQADKISHIWLAKLKESQPGRRLNYIYLVNDIVQNALSRKRSEFPHALAPLMPEACQVAYKSATTDVQNKLRRVVDVWVGRNVFDASIIKAIQNRLDEVDKAKGGGGGKKSLIGNSLFSSASSTSIPKELETLGQLQTALNKADFASKSLVDAAQTEHAKVSDGSNQPSPPVYAANLSSLIKKLSAAETSLGETVNAQKAMIAEIEKLVSANKAALVKNEKVLSDLQENRTTAEFNKREVEDSIMQGLGSEDGDLAMSGNDRPDVEELTPEPEVGLSSNAGDPNYGQEPVEPASRNPALRNLLAGFDPDDTGSAIEHPISQDRTSILDVPPAPPAEGPIIPAPHTAANGPASSKKRKLSHSHQDSAHDQQPPALDSYTPPGLPSQQDTIPSYDPAALQMSLDSLIQSQGMDTTSQQGHIPGLPPNQT